MNSILLRTLQPVRSPSLLAFSDYREAEQANSSHSSVAANGCLLEYETLELRVHPPNVNIDNETYSDRTLITLDSANRPGTLVEVVQLLTELGLCVTKARISSDGGWFVDEFACTDSGKKVINERKLRAIRKVLSVDADPSTLDGVDGCIGGSLEEASSSASTIFELAGWDRMGLLADVVALLKNNGCEVRSAAVWTANGRCAFVLSVLDGAASGAVPAPIRDGIKLARLRQLLLSMLEAAGGGGSGSGDCVVNVGTSKGLIHYERRLHQLLLREEEAEWRRQEGLAARYEAEIAAQQATQERRCAGARAASPATVPALTAVTSAPVAGLRPPLAPLQPGNLPQAAATAAVAVATLASPGSLCAGKVTPPPTPPQVASVEAAMAAAKAAAEAAEAAAANVRPSAGSPTIGSPEGSAHGGTAAGRDGDGSGAVPAPSSADAASGELGPGFNGQPSVGGAGPEGSNASAGSSGAPTVVLPSEGAPLSATSSASCTSPNALPAAALAPPPSPAPPPAPRSWPSSAAKPEVWVSHSRQHNYWTVSIRCRDRQKLLFDTVCTLADLNYDVYHGSVDCEIERDRGGAPVSIALQTFYMRPRFGDALWDARRAAKLKYMLEAAIQRRQPLGTKVHIQAAPAGAAGMGVPVGSGAGGVGGGGFGGDLPSLTAVWRDFGLCISRAKVRALAGPAGEHTFYLVDGAGRPPPDSVVQAACQQIGGVRLASATGGASGVGGGAVVGSAAAAAAAAKSGGVARGEAARFGFVVYSRPGWAGGRESPASSVADSV